MFPSTSCPTAPHFSIIRQQIPKLKFITLQEPHVKPTHQACLCSPVSLFIYLFLSDSKRKLKGSVSAFLKKNFPLDITRAVHSGVFWLCKEFSGTLMGAFITSLRLGNFDDGFPSPKFSQILYYSVTYEQSREGWDIRTSFLRAVPFCSCLSLLSLVQSNANEICSVIETSKNQTSWVLK